VKSASDISRASSASGQLHSLRNSSSSTANFRIISASPNSVKRSNGFDQLSQARSGRAKTKHGQDAGRSHSGAMGPTEDAARRRFAAARTEPGSTDRTRAILRNTFETVPDAPVSKFVLEMQGGKKGLLVNKTDVCKGTRRAFVATAQLLRGAAA